MHPAEKSFLGLDSRGFHRVAYVEWGDAGREAVVCVHGLTRNSRDFDHLAQALSTDRRVVCPDMPGRGRSDWLAAKGDYGMPLYMADMTALIARMDVASVDWVGTSMGGIIGMLMASRPNSPVRRLVLNDIGAFIPRAGLDRIGGNVGQGPLFRTVEEAEDWFRSRMVTFGLLEDSHWRHIAMHGLRRDPEGGFRLHYDPGIAEPMNAQPVEDIDLWAVWDAISCPVLVLRGVQSDIITEDVARQMKARGPGCEVIEFPEVGHAPMLMSPEQIRPILDWLEAAP